jgi:hypothetical protein
MKRMRVTTHIKSVDKLPDHHIHNKWGVTGKAKLQEDLKAASVEVEYVKGIDHRYVEMARLHEAGHVEYSQDRIDNQPETITHGEVFEGDLFFMETDAWIRAMDNIIGGNSDYLDPTPVPLDCTKLALDCLYSYAYGIVKEKATWLDAKEQLALRCEDFEAAMDYVPEKPPPGQGDPDGSFEVVEQLEDHGDQDDRDGEDSGDKGGGEDGRGENAQPGDEGKGPKAKDKGTKGGADGTKDNPRGGRVPGGSEDRLNQERDAWLVSAEGIATTKMGKDHLLRALSILTFSMDESTFPPITKALLGIA